MAYFNTTLVIIKLNTWDDISDPATYFNTTLVIIKPDPEINPPHFAHISIQLLLLLNARKGPDSVKNGVFQYNSCYY